MSAIIIQTTYPNDGRQLKRFVTAILKKGLAKCIQRHNYCKSYYIWEGKLEMKEEKILHIKSTADKKEVLIAFIKKLHPYDVPEILVIVPDEVDEGYMKWLEG